MLLPGFIPGRHTQSIIDAQLVKYPIDQLHRYVRILLGGRIEEPFRILGLWRRAVYILYGPAQFLCRGLTMIGVMATCIMRGVQPLQYRGHPMWDFNGEDDATRYGRKGPDSAAALLKILSTLYKGEEEEFLRVNPQGGFSMHNPPS